jgi:hypothetical protein
MALTVAASDSIDFPPQIEGPNLLTLTYIKQIASSNREKRTHINGRGRLPKRGLPVSGAITGRGSEA